MKIKIIYGSIGFCVLCIIGFLIYYIIATTGKYENKLIDADLKLGRAATTLVDQKQLHKEKLKDLTGFIKSAIEKNNELVVKYGELEAKYSVELKRKKTITTVIYKDRTEIVNIDLPKNKMFMHLDSGEYKEVTSLKYNYKDFRIDINGDVLTNTVGYKLHQTFKGKLLETKTKDNKSSFYFQLFELDDKKKEVATLSLSSFNVFQTANGTYTKQIQWWNPKLDLSIGSVLNTDLKVKWIGMLGISCLSYGLTKNDLTWRFLHFTAGIGEEVLSLNFTPVLYNIGEPLPLVSNLWIGPNIGYNFLQQNSHFGLGLGVIF